MKAKIPDWQTTVLNVEEFQKLAVERKYKFVSHDGKLKVIKIDTGKKDHIYEVDLDQCKTAAACLDWIHQLHEKSWFDADRHEEFIDLFFKVIDVHLWEGTLLWGNL
jgi:hypothetical protein